VTFGARVRCAEVRRRSAVMARGKALPDECLSSAWIVCRWLGAAGVSPSRRRGARSRERLLVRGRPGRRSPDRSPPPEAVPSPTQAPHPRPPARRRGTLPAPTAGGSEGLVRSGWGPTFKMIVLSAALGTTAEDMRPVCADGQPVRRACPRTAGAGVAQVGDAWAGGAVVGSAVGGAVGGGASLS
jgi:hypothetical protein